MQLQKTLENTKNKLKKLNYQLNLKKKKKKEVENDVNYFKQEKKF